MKETVRALETAIEASGRRILSSTFHFLHSTRNIAMRITMASHELPTTDQKCILASIKLPYLRPPDQLPRHLPSTDEILAGKPIPTNREAMASEDGRVVIVGDCFVVKYGVQIRENEGYALLLLENSPSIPSPQLYAMWRHGDVLYLVMELIPGQNLRTLWGTLSENEKSSICSQLRQAFTHIRSIPSTGSFGNIVGGPLPHLFFGSYTGDPRIMGPFQTSEDLHAGLALHAQRQQERNMRHGWNSEWLARHLPEALKDQPSTFTHGDLIKQNIMVQEQPGADGQTDRQFLLTGLIDWEMAGWYPQYWEYANLFIYAYWEDDWEAKAELFIDPYPREAALLKMVRVEIEGF